MMNEHGYSGMDEVYVKAMAAGHESSAACVSDDSDIPLLAKLQHKFLLSFLGSNNTQIVSSLLLCEFIATQPMVPKYCPLVSWSANSCLGLMPFTAESQKVLLESWMSLGRL